MKKINFVGTVSILIMAMTSFGAAIPETKGKNLIKKIEPIPKSIGTEIDEGGIIFAENKTTKERNGAYKIICIKPSSDAPLFFSAESKCENVFSKKSSRYAIYVDLQYDDNSYEYGITFKFNTGNSDWEKGEIVFIPKKKVKLIAYYLMFRGKTGRVWFKNPVCRLATDKEIKNFQPPKAKK